MAQRRRLTIGLWVLATVGGALLVLEMRGHAPEGYVLSTCLFRRMTGIPCPLCGMTRAFFAMLRGEWREVFALHPLAPFLALECAAIWAVAGAWAGGGLRTLQRSRVELFAEKLILSNAALFVLVWGARLYFHALAV